MEKRGAHQKPTFFERRRKELFSIGAVLLLSTGVGYKVVADGPARAETPVPCDENTHNGCTPGSTITMPAKEEATTTIPTPTTSEVPATTTTHPDITTSTMPDKSTPSTPPREEAPEVPVPVDRTPGPLPKTH